MSEPFIGQIKMVGFNFAPRGWALCEGQLVDISQNPSLFSILGTTYGGDGRTTFGLPDLRGRVAIHNGGSTGPGLSPRPLGGKSGEERHQLTVAEVPPHTHTVSASDLTPQEDDPAGNVWANSDDKSGYSSTVDGTMHTSAVSSAGGGQAHENMQPFLGVYHVIALVGVFPSRN
jgi:microcystin-dependent protein